jgi:hypothetical protein
MLERYWGWVYVITMEAVTEDRSGAVGTVAYNTGNLFVLSPLLTHSSLMELNPS